MRCTRLMRPYVSVNFHVLSHHRVPELRQQVIDVAIDPQTLFQCAMRVFLGTGPGMHYARLDSGRLLPLVVMQFTQQIV